MPTLIFALAEAAAEPAGDAFARAAYTLLAIAMIVAFVAAYVVTDKGGDHH